MLVLSLAATVVEYLVIRTHTQRQARETFDREIQINLDNARDGLWRYAYAARTVAVAEELDWHQHLRALRDLGLANDTVRFVNSGQRPPRYPVGTDFSTHPALLAARRSRQPVATGPVDCLLFVPVKNGFGFAAFDATELWQELLRPAQLSPVAMRLLGPDETAPPAHEFCRTILMPIWGLRWRLLCTPRSTFATVAELNRPWLFLAGGLVMTIAVSGITYGQAWRRIRLQRQTDELGRLKSQFVSTVSHEFRTPLGVIVSSAGILDRYLDRLPPEQRCEHLANIQTAGKRMAELMENALLFSRLEANRLAFNPQPLDLAALCREVAAECGDRVVCQLTPTQITGDEALLRQILTNLLTNALKYSQEPVVLELRDRTLRVRDHGIGIPAAEREKLGEPFWRASNAGAVPGTGVGLFIVKRCVELHGASWCVESEVGKGTTITVNL